MQQITTDNQQIDELESKLIELLETKKIKPFQKTLNNESHFTHMVSQVLYAQYLILTSFEIKQNFDSISTIASQRILFQFLELNQPKNDEMTLCSINQMNKGLKLEFQDVHELMQVHIQKCTKYCNILEKYWKTLLEIFKKDDEKETMEVLIKFKTQLTTKDSIQVILEKSITYFKKQVRDFVANLIIVQENEFSKIVDRFLDELFDEDISFLFDLTKTKANGWEYLNILKNKFEIEPPQKYVPSEFFNLHQLNIASADLKIKVSCKDGKNQEKVFPVYDPDHLILFYSDLQPSTKAFLRQEVDDSLNSVLPLNFDKDLKEALRIKGCDCSEKGIIGLILTRIKDILQQLFNQVEGIAKLVEISVYIYSTASCCPSCHIFLNQRFGEIYRTSLLCLQKLDPNIKGVDKEEEVGLQKYLAFTSQRNNDVANAPSDAKKGKVIFCRDPDPKNYFYYKFLKQSLFIKKDPPAKRTYVLSTPPQGETELKEGLKRIENYVDSNLTKIYE